MAYSAKEKKQAVVGTILLTGILWFKISVACQPEHYVMQNWWAIVITSFFLLSLILYGNSSLLLISVCASFVFYAVILLSDEVSPFVPFLMLIDGYIFLIAGFPTFFIVSLILHRFFIDEPKTEPEIEAPK